MAVTKALVCQCGAQKTSHHGVLVCTKHCDKARTRNNCPVCRKIAARLTLDGSGP